MIREIVKIDEVKCNGCGLCVPACAEGAIKIIGGKARLIADNLCDGLGACLGHCPQDAIVIERRAAGAFDEEAVDAHLHGAKKPTSHGKAGGCPSARVMIPGGEEKGTESGEGRRPSALRQWPVQMHLVPPSAPFLQDADLLLAADCVPFACADFHPRFLEGKALLIGCPKLDDGQAYLEKLTSILRSNDIRRLTVVHMEVPCCTGLVMIARRAIAESGRNVPLETVRMGLQGEVK
jgi:NAD-dependent dihydropyrimidine dehydrogenase PreA subunit